ncbi:MAG: peptidase [Firmicutes bacterium]|nr:peptidase [Bacillota bacterium]
MNLLVHPKEKFYFKLSLIISILIYLMLVLSIVGIVYIIMGVVIGFIVQGLAVGQIRGNGVRISESQFPEVYKLADQIASKMEIKQMPPVYIIQSGGLLNAFAMRFLGRNYVVIYSEVFELAYEQGEDALAFILSHEFAHIKRKHLSWRWFLFPSTFIPFLSQAYSRACEYTCDRIAAYNQPAGAMAGLLVLAAGKRLYKNVDAAEYVKQANREAGFWIWIAEKLSTHPNLPYRILAIDQKAQMKVITNRELTSI